MGIPFVSGRKMYTKIVMTVIHPEKKRKIPNLKAHRRNRKDWAMMKVNSRFTATVMLCPAERVSNGNISLGTVQPSGPHDHPKAATKRQMNATTKIENSFESFSSLPNLSPKTIATITCLHCTRKTSC